MQEVKEAAQAPVSVQIKDGRCFVLVQPTGERAKLMSFRTRSEADTAAELIKQRLEKPRPAMDVSFDDFYDLWREKHLLRECSARYVAQCEGVNRMRLSPRIGRFSLAEVDKECVEALKRAFDAELGLRQSYKQLDVLSAVLGKAVAWWYLKENPVEKIR